MEIADYPQVRPLNKDMKDLFCRVLYNESPEISELTFSNLYGWNYAYNIQVSILDGAIILCSDMPQGKRFFCLLEQKKENNNRKDP